MRSHAPSRTHPHIPALDQSLPLLLTVEEAGTLVGWSRDQSYRAAKTDTLPTIRQGARLYVPTARFLKQLGLSTQRVDVEVSQ